jgi:hypothetical protein
LPIDNTIEVDYDTWCLLVFHAENKCNYEGRSKEEIAAALSNEFSIPASAAMPAIEKAWKNVETWPGSRLWQAKQRGKRK